MFLVSTTQSIEAVLSGAVTANQLHIVAAYADHTTTTFVPGVNSIETNNTTGVTVVAAPAASTQRQVTCISIFNADTADATITVRLNDNSTLRTIIKCTIKPGETLGWHPKTGWSTVTAGGLYKTGGVTHLAKDTCVLPVGFWTGGVGTSKTLVTNFSYGCWMGRAEKAYTSASIQYRVTVAAATITWAEAAVATGAVQMGSTAGAVSASLLTTRGFTDVSAVINSTGIKTTTVALSGIQPGDDLWVLLGNQATTAAQIRSTSNADNLSVGRCVESASGIRPSTMLGGTEFTLDGTVTGWLAATFS